MGRKQGRLSNEDAESAVTANRSTKLAVRAKSINNVHFDPTGLHTDPLVGATDVIILVTKDSQQQTVKSLKKLATATNVFTFHLISELSI
jgi:hypothetical protein